MLPVGHCQVSPPLRPLQAETTVVGSQQGLRCGSICPVTTGQESVVNRCATSPHSVQISHPRRQGPSTQETILSDHPQQCTVLPRCCLSGAPEDLPGTKEPVAACLLSMRLTVARVKPTRAAIAPCLMPSRASANTSCLIPIGVGRDIVRTIKKSLKKYANIDSKLSQCEDWFGGTTTYTVVSELDDPTWPCIECLPKVVSDFVGEQSRVHIMPISAKWKHKSSIHIGFIFFNGGVTTFFAKSVIEIFVTLKHACVQECKFHRPISFKKVQNQWRF